MGTIRLSRVYDHEAPVGSAFLVERLWPRGVRRAEVPIDGWLKDVAPSQQLRQWYRHDVAKWEEFRRRYVGELDGNPDAWRPLADLAASDGVTLLYSARDREHNSALVLKEYLLAHLPSDTSPR